MGGALTLHVEKTGCALLGACAVFWSITVQDIQERFSFHKNIQEIQLGLLI